MTVLQPHCRQHFTLADFDFIQSTLHLAEGAQALRERLFVNKDTLDQLLDEEKLCQRIIECPEQINISSNLYFYVLVRHILRQHAIESRALADYIASICLTFVSAHGAQSLATPEPPIYAIDYLQKIEQTVGIEQFNLRVQLANRMLFTTGIFPDYVQHRVERVAAPNIKFYEAIGSGQYRMVANHHFAHEYGLSAIFETLGSEFTCMREALNVFRDRFMLFRTITGLEDLIN